MIYLSDLTTNDIAECHRSLICTGGRGAGGAGGGASDDTALLFDYCMESKPTSNVT